MIHWGAAVFASVVVGLASFGATAWHVDKVNDRDRLVHAVQNQNYYASRVVTPDAARSAGPVDHLVRFLRPALEAKDPVGALLKVHVPVAEFHDVNSILATDVAYMETQTDKNPRTGETGDGELTSEFILLTAQALHDPHAAMTKVPPKLDDGWFTWLNAALATMSIFLIYAVVVLPLTFTVESVKEARKRRKHRAYLRSLTPTQRTVLEIKNELEPRVPKYRSDRSTWDQTPEGKAYAKACEAWEIATSGWKNTERTQRLSELMSELNLAIESEKEGQRVYREL